MFTKKTDKKVVSAPDLKHNWSLMIPGVQTPRYWINFLPSRLDTIYGTINSDFLNHNRKFEQSNPRKLGVGLRPTCTTPTYHFE